MTDAPDDASMVDAAIVDAQMPPALCGIASGQWTLSTPEPLEVNDLLIMASSTAGDRSEFDPVLSESGLELYVTSDQSGGFFVWVATRPSLSAPFDSVTQLGSDVNAASNLHFGFQPITSLSRAIISAPYTGSLGDTDYWLGTFGGAVWTWNPTSLSTTIGDGDARMSASGLDVYFSRGDAPSRDIYHASRVDLDQDFGAPESVADLNSPSSDSAPFLVPSGAGMFIASDRPGDAGGEDIYYAASSGVGFERPYPLTQVNSAAFDGEPTFIELGSTCELIFVSTRSGSFNLYRSLVSRL